MERHCGRKSPLGHPDQESFDIRRLHTYDKSFRYWVDVANIDPSTTLELLLHEQTLPGFNDSGAHLTNLAFFDGNLCALQLAQRESMETFSTMVRRLTTEPAEFFGLDTGSLAIGAQADLTLINPRALASYDTNASHQLVYREIFEHEQLVNSSDGVVAQVFIRGDTVWKDNNFTDALGTRTLGRALRAA